MNKYALLLLVFHYANTCGMEKKAQGSGPTQTLRRRNNTEQSAGTQKQPIQQLMSEGPPNSSHNNYGFHWENFGYNRQQPQENPCDNWLCLIGLAGFVFANALK